MGNKQDSRKMNLAKNTAILGIGTIFSKCLSFLIVPLLSRWLSTSEFGNFDLYASYTSLLIPLATLSSSEALFRFLVDNSDEKERQRIVTNVAIISALGSFLLSILILFFKNILFRELETSFVLYLLSAIIYEFCVFYLRGVKRLKIYALTGTISLLSNFILVFVLVWFFDLGTAGMIWANTGSFAVTSAIIVFMTKMWRSFDLKLVDKKAMIEILHYCLPMIPNSISWWVVNVSDRTIIRLFLGSAFNGVYAIAYKIPTICTTFFGVFSLSWQENITLTINSGDRNTYINTVFNKTVQVIISICLPIISINFFLFSKVFNLDYFEGIFQVPILMLSVVFNVIAQFYGGIFVALKEPKWNGITTVISAVVNLIIHLSLVNYIGLYAASLSTTLCFMILSITRHIILRRSNDIKVRVNCRTILCFLIFLAFCGADMMHSYYVSVCLFGLGCAIFILINIHSIKIIGNKVLRR